MRAKGNSSLATVASNDDSDRYSFKIKLNEYESGQNYYGLKQFVLNNNIGDATYMKEYMSYDLMQSMGIATPGFAFASITVNGEPWGLYLAVEVMNDSFVERQFNTLDGNLYKPESMDMGGGNQLMQPPTNGGQLPEGVEGNQMMDPFMNEGEISEGVERNQFMQPGIHEDEMDSNSFINEGGMKKGMQSSLGSNLVYTDDIIESYSSIFDNIESKNTTEEDQRNLIEIIKKLSEGIELETYLDIEEILRYFAVNTFLVNLDSYAGQLKHNYYLYELEGVLQILPWDLNLSFGAFQMSEASKVVNFPIDAPVTDSMENSPLISKLLDVDEYKEMYHLYLEELVNVYILSGYYEQTIQTTHELISDYVMKDATAFYTYDEYLVGYQELFVFGQDRAASILAQIKGEQPSTTYGNIPTDLNLKVLGNQENGKQKMNRDKMNQEEGSNKIQQSSKK
ncbi:MAG: CotH kinase family protein [Turicibacter sp.]